MNLRFGCHGLWWAQELFLGSQDAQELELQTWSRSRGCKRSPGKAALQQSYGIDLHRESWDILSLKSDSLLVVPVQWRAVRYLFWSLGSSTLHSIRLIELKLKHTDTGKAKPEEVLDPLQEHWWCPWSSTVDDSFIYIIWLLVLWLCHLWANAAAPVLPLSLCWVTITGPRGQQYDSAWCQNASLWNANWQAEAMSTPPSIFPTFARYWEKLLARLQVQFSSPDWMSAQLGLCFSLGTDSPAVCWASASHWPRW